MSLEHRHSLPYIIKTVNDTIYHDNVNYLFDVEYSIHISDCSIDQNGHINCDIHDQLFDHLKDICIASDVDVDVDVDEINLLLLKISYGDHPICNNASVILTLNGFTITDGVLTPILTWDDHGSESDHESEPELGLESEPEPELEPELTWRLNESWSQRPTIRYSFMY